MSPLQNSQQPCLILWSAEHLAHCCQSEYIKEESWPKCHRIMAQRRQALHGLLLLAFEEPMAGCGRDGQVQKRDPRQWHFSAAQLPEHLPPIKRPQSQTSPVCLLASRLETLTAASLLLHTHHWNSPPHCKHWPHIFIFFLGQVQPLFFPLCS